MISTMFLMFFVIGVTITIIFLILLFLEALFLIAKYIYENSAFIDFIIRRIKNRRNKWRSIKFYFQK